MNFLIIKKLGAQGIMFWWNFLTGTNGLLFFELTGIGLAVV